MPQKKLKDICSWILRHSRQVFDSFTCWQAEMVGFLIGFEMQKEEEWFSAQADRYAQDMMHGTRLKSFSKDYCRVLRHKKDTWIFDNRGAVEISVLFQKMGRRSPLNFGMNGAKFAAFCMQTTRRDSSLTLPSMTTGAHIKLYRHGRSAWEQFKVIQTRSKTLLKCTMLSQK